MAEGGGVLPPIVLELRAKATELYSELGHVKSELKEVDKEAQEAGRNTTSTFDKVAKYGKTLAVGIAGAAVAVGGFAVETASAAEVVDAQLKTAVENAGGSYDDLEPKIEAADAMLRKFGYTNEETNTALTTATIALKDPQKALDALGVAADLAREKNIDLNTATLLVTKAMEGQTRPLKALGIDLPVAAGNAKAVADAQDKLATAQQNVNDILAKYPAAADAGAKGHEQYQKATEAVQKAQENLTEAQNAGGQIFDELKSRVSGAADAYGNTLKGKIDAAKAAISDFAEGLGKWLIPKITELIQDATELWGWLDKHRAILYTLSGIITGVVVVAIGAWIAQVIKATALNLLSFGQMIIKATVWAASTAVSIGETIYLWGLYAIEGLGAVASATAAWAIEQGGILLAWATSTATQIWDTVALWAMYAYETLADVVTAAAKGFAAMIAAGAQWIAEQAVQFAEAAVNGATWIAEHIAMGVVAVVQYGIIAAAATAAFIAENAASLGIIAAIGLVIAAIVWLVTHWSEAWDAIKTAAQWVWENVLKPVFNFIDTVAIKPIGAAIQWLGGVWKTIWDAIGAAAKWVYDNVIKPVADWINKYVIQPIGEAIKTFSDVWGKAWDAISSVVSTVAGVIKGIIGGIVDAVKSAIQWVENLLGLDAQARTDAANTRLAVSGANAAHAGAEGAAAGSALAGRSGYANAGALTANLPSRDIGGWIPGEENAPQPILAHGREYMLSVDMLRGRQPIDPAVVSAIARQLPSSPSQAAFESSGSPSASGPSVTVIANSNASAYGIAGEVGWILRRQA